jgi:hypothetical protein
MKTGSRFPVRRVAELDADPQPQRWLIESLWSDQAVGIVGGEPKCCKSFLALDLAVSVASGAPCLRRFPARQRGPVLLFAAEDPLYVVRRRLQAIALAANVDFDTLDIHVITAPTLRLDLEQDRRRLRATVEKLQPRLLVLDPFVRLHRADENVVADVAPLLDYLRQLQRSFHTAVLLVHHARKRAGGTRAGQALRGSSEMHAWGDSLLYLRRCRGGVLRLSVEHRAAASVDDLDVELKAQGNALALQLIEGGSRVRAPDDRAPSIIDRVQHELAQASTPLSMRQLRQACRMRMSTVAQILDELIADGRAIKEPDGFRLAKRPSAFPVSRPSIDPTGNGGGKHRLANAQIKLQLLPGETESGSAGAQPDEG